MLRDSKSLNRRLGLFSYYSQWIPEFSERIKPLTSCKSFPLSPEAVTTFDSLKKIVKEAFVAAIHETMPFEVETDASDVALAGTLSQDGRPVAFLSRSLQGSELKHASIEKEAQAIIEAIKNLLYSLDEVKRVTSQCQTCAETKPRYHKPEEVPLIKATQPFERINIDFKGPLPSNNGNKYFLNIVDEYSRFPFVFPCFDISTSTVIKCLTTLISLFGMAAFVHWDSGASFMSHELQAFLREKEVATSRTTSYNPAGNGQV